MYSRQLMWLHWSKEEPTTISTCVSARHFSKDQKLVARLCLLTPANHFRTSLVSTPVPSMTVSIPSSTQFANQECIDLLSLTSAADSRAFWPWAISWNMFWWMGREGKKNEGKIPNILSTTWNSSFRRSWHGKLWTTAVNSTNDFLTTERPRTQVPHGALHE